MIGLKEFRTVLSIANLYLWGFLIMDLSLLTREEKEQIYREMAHEYLKEDVDAGIEIYVDYYFNNNKNDKLVEYLEENIENIAKDIENDKNYGDTDFTKEYFLDTYFDKYIKKFEELCKGKD